jgi:acyl-CoA ligase (AMP-forming) (exosortase A-associated)
MPTLLHDLLFDSAATRPESVAIVHRRDQTTYAELAALVDAVARGLLARGLARTDRVAFYLPKRLETVAIMFGALRAGGVFVPINPLLKSEQVGHVVRDSGARFLITTADRYAELRGRLADCTALTTVVLLDRDANTAAAAASPTEIDWAELVATTKAPPAHSRIDADIASILYTSGSTGKPKGVVLSHRNMLAGAASVAQYLENTADDRILAVLPFSFDYGFSQLSTGFLRGARVVLLDYLLARDVVNAVAEHGITGLAGVPPLWIQLAALNWPEAAVKTLRYITNSGGAMPQTTLATLRQKLPRTRPFLMYGLTEAFRSTFLPPEEIDRRPGSMGKAIPNAEIVVVRPDGTLCEPREPGELVHRGALVSLGYWNQPETTAQRFKPAPGLPQGLPNPELAVWSGDTVMRDEDGFLYFVARRDEMIKTSGYRVSPTEIEEVLLGTGLVSEAVALGVDHPTLGQAIVVMAVAAAEHAADSAKLLAECKQRLPTFMIPTRVEWRTAIPRNPNGKMDRKSIADELKSLFADAAK